MMWENLSSTESLRPLFLAMSSHPEGLPPLLQDYPLLQGLELPVQSLPPLIQGSKVKSVQELGKGK